MLWWDTRKIEKKLSWLKCHLAGAESVWPGPVRSPDKAARVPGPARTSGRSHVPTPAGEHEPRGEMNGRDDCAEPLVAAAEKELAEDAAWKRIQKNTFTRWCNEHLRAVGRQIDDLQRDFSDGLRLVALLEVLSQKRMCRKHHARPTFRQMQLENVSVALEFLERENIKLVSIDSKAIVDGNLKLILGLVWTLILHYSISMPVWEDEEEDEAKKQTPKQRLLGWIQHKLPDLPISNFSQDWQDGRALGALVDSCAPGLCPDWEIWDVHQPVDNAREAMQQAEDWLGVAQVIAPEEIVDPNVDEHSVMTYLSQFPKAKLKPGAPLRPKLNPKNARAYGPGVEPVGNSVERAAEFVVETENAGLGEVLVFVEDPEGHKEEARVTPRNDKQRSFAVLYRPRVTGPHKVTVLFAGQHIDRSPFSVHVAPPHGDAGKVTARGPGLEPTGNLAGKATYFDICTAGAGAGDVTVVVLDPRGRRDAVELTLEQRRDSLLRCTYRPALPGPHAVSVGYAGATVPHSPFSVHIGEACNPGACRASGRGLQSRGVRVGDAAGFRVLTKQAGSGELNVLLRGPRGEEPMRHRELGDGAHEFEYKPLGPGPHVIAVTWGGKHIPRSPFEVLVSAAAGPQKVRAWGPGLETGMAGRSADFVVEAIGTDVGTLGFSIEGPSQARIACDDRGDGSCDVRYVPTEPGDYAVHVLCDEEDVALSPFMAHILPAARDCFPERVLASGPGLDATACLVSTPTHFSVDTRAGGKGNLKVYLQDVEGQPVPVQVAERPGGVYECCYAPEKPIKHTIIITWAGVNIPDSPYRVTVGEGCHPERVKVYGPGVESGGVKAHEPTYFTVDCSEAGQGDVSVGIKCAADATGPIDSDVHFDIIKNDNDTFTVKYTPPCAGRFTVMVFFSEQEVPGTPFGITVVPSHDASRVRVEGPGINATGVEAAKPAHFTVHTRGAGKAELDVQFEDPRVGTPVPILDSEIIDNHDYSYTVKYTPGQQGGVCVGVTYGGDHVPGSPFPITVAPPLDLSKIRVEGLGTKLEMGREQEVRVVTRGAGGRGRLDARLLSPARHPVPCLSEPLAEAQEHALLFALLEAGPHRMDVTYDGHPVPGSPFLMEAVLPANPSQVRVWGEGLRGGEVGVPAEFCVDTTAAGVGGLGLTVEGPCEARLQCHDHGDGTCSVSYLPVQAGEYAVNILFADAHVPGSPFTAVVKPSVETSGVQVFGPGVEKALRDAVSEFAVDARAVSRCGGEPVRCAVTAPSGATAEGSVTDNRDGTYAVEYVPRETGPHTVEVTYSGARVPRSPFRVAVSDGCDPSRVRVHGPGLEGGLTHRANVFNIDTRAAGCGGLGLHVEGPGEAHVAFEEDPEGGFTVEYHASSPGEYLFHITYGGTAITGSPFGVPVRDEVNPAKVRCSGPGLGLSGAGGVGAVRAGAPQLFNVDCSRAGDAALDVTAHGPHGVLEPVEVVRAADGLHAVTYTPSLAGPYSLRVEYAGQGVPHSPFAVDVLPAYDASRVRVSGAGVSAAGVPASLPTDFTIDTREAGDAPLSITVVDPDGCPRRARVLDASEGLFSVSYLPDVAGRYSVGVSYGADEVPGSPFPVHAFPTGDASKCFLADGGPGPAIQIGEPTLVLVNAKEAGRGKVTCRVLTPEQLELDVDVVENPSDGTFSIVFTATQPGPYVIAVRFGGQLIPNSPFHVLAMSEDISTESLRPFHLVVPFSLRKGHITGEVHMPSGRKASPRMIDNRDGTMSISFAPIEKGLHEMDIKYNGHHIPGSPLQFYVDEMDGPSVTAYGPGLSHGTVGKPAAFTIDTKDAGEGGLSLAVEGPSKAEISCQDNKDGTCSVSYLPSAPGDYNIAVKFAGQHIPGSPYMARITGEDSLRSSLLSRGSTHDVSLRVPDTDPALLTADITAPSGRQDACLLKRLDDGQIGISFSPKEVGEHLVSVREGGRHVASSPFRVAVAAAEVGDARRVRASGLGLEEARTCEAAEFIVDTRYAGFGSMCVSMEGPSRVELHCEDLEDGRCRVWYCPPEPGTYHLAIKFAEEQIPGSPFTVLVTGPGRQKEEMSLCQAAVPVAAVGSTCSLPLAIPDTERAGLGAEVRGPSGRIHPAELVDGGPSVYCARFEARELGAHAVSVRDGGGGGGHVPGSPFPFTVGPLGEGGAHRVRAAGPGLEHALAGEPAEFGLWAREAGAGAITVAVEGPGKATISSRSTGDGAYILSYLVQEPGDYEVSVRFEDEHIPGSPFLLTVDGVCEESQGVTVSGLLESGWKVNHPASFAVHLNGAKGRIEAKVHMPSGSVENCFVSEIDKDKLAVRFMPRENGVHSVSVKCDGAPVAGSPFRVRVGEPGHAANAGLVAAFGPGLERGTTGSPAEFVVDTSGAGPGSLAVAIDGPSKVRVDCSEGPEGYRFCYLPTAPGLYLVSICYGGPHHIAGSPYRARITGPRLSGGHNLHETSSFLVEAGEPRRAVNGLGSEALPLKAASDSSKVEAHGPGLSTALVGKQNAFTVDCGRAGSNVLLVGVLGPSVPCEEVHVRHTGGRRYAVAYAVKERGSYLLIVKWGDEHVPGSPFRVTVP